MRRYLFTWPSFTGAALLLIFASIALSSCVTARPLKEEKTPGIFSGASGEYVIYQDGGRKRK